MPSRQVVERTYATLFGSGATLLLATVAAAPAGHASLPGLFAAAAAAYALTVLLLRHGTVPESLLPWVPGGGTLLVTVVGFSASAETFPYYLLLYFWVVFSASYFGTPRVATAHLVCVLVALGGVLGARGDHVLVPLAMIGGTQIVAGVLLQALRRHARRQELLRRDAEELFRRSFEDAPIGISVCSAEQATFGRFLAVNRALCRILGRSEDDLLATGFDTVVHPADKARTTDDILRLVRGDTAEVVSEVRCVRPDGEIAWLAFNSTVVRSAAGAPLSLLTQAQDVTARRTFEAHLRYLADHDELTGLLNRRRLQDVLRDCASTGAAVLVVDLDNFKHLNDVAGHRAGDELLRAVARRLRSEVRSTDTVARLGGDEFAVVLPGATRAAGERVARQLTAALREVGAASGHAIRPTASIGVAVWEPGSAVNPDQLLADADMALYDAKGAGRSTFRVSPAAHPHDGSGRGSWSARIRTALEQDGFVLHAQPIVELGTGVVSGHELLVRMRDGDKLVPPGAFLSVAERLDLVQEIDLWVVRDAVRLMAGYDARGLHVNVSARTVGDPESAARIEAEIARVGVDPSGLVFELTETTAVANMEQARVFGERIRGLGCGLALDDFGSCFGSFHYLKHLPFDVLKIDGEFVAQLPRNPTDQALLRGIVGVADQLGLRTIAEWATDEETIALLREYGVDCAQGFGLGVPQPAAAYLSRSRGRALRGAP